MSVAKISSYAYNLSVAKISSYAYNSEAMDEQALSLVNKVKTRFAPSPTGLMHIGQVRTALYSYLLAKQNNGIFLLRIEDTDRERLIEGSAENIIQTLEWLNLSWQEGPIYQSQRLEIYTKYAEELVGKNIAYKKDGAIWFKAKKDGQTSWTDNVGNKTISIQNSLQDDFVLIKSDGYPTYNFAVVIDDYLMEITDVVRGVEFISSTPKHIMLYKAFNWPLPRFVHLPLILGSDRSKLSKRHGAKPAWEFKQDGYLPEAVLNFMALLGWTPSNNQEILSLEEMIKIFNVKDLNVSNPIFDVNKLEWMNGEYIRKSQNSNLKAQIRNYLSEISYGTLTKKDHPTEEEIEKVIPLIKERITKLSDFVPLTNFLWEDPEYDINEFQKIKVENQKEILKKILKAMESLPNPWTSDKFEGTFRKLAEDEKIKAGDIFQLIRVAVSGQLVTPPLFESIMILGEEQALNRIKNVADKYPNFE